MASGTIQTTTRPISATVLIVDDEDATRNLCNDVVTDSGLRTRTASTTEQALEILEQMPVDILITDLRVPQIGGLELAETRSRNYPQTAVLVLTQYGTIESAVEATRLGAADYITKPFHITGIARKLDRMVRVLNVDQENRVLARNSAHAAWFRGLIGVSLKMQRVYRLIEKVSQHNYPVLILGESGTGKELVARSVHFSGVRRNKPFIPVDCSSLVPTLIEAELFGYVKGAFTGAMHTKQGLMEIADNGTLFLDEIGDLPFDIAGQAPARVAGKRSPAGGLHRTRAAFRSHHRRHQSRPGRIRAARNVSPGPFLPAERGTNQDSSAARAEDAIFRSWSIRFWKNSAKRTGKTRTISEDAIARLMAYDWPGNVRELENAIERAVALGSGPHPACRRSSHEPSIRHR